MTAADAPELVRARQWAGALAGALDEITEQVGAAARRLADGWPDPLGWEWSERLHALRRSIGHDADDAHALGRAIDRVADAWSTAGPVTGPLGPQLGGTGARRADDRRGVVIPVLGDPGPG